MEQSTPRVFISHSTEDKDRFVRTFAERLRLKGIDAWLDEWELLPGDSLVDKIWNEGIKDCSAFIVILSRQSIRSKWVREELNSGVVRRIEGKAKLIPIRLDGCEIPEALKHSYWIEITDVANYDREFERIVNSIFGQYEKPPLGGRPSYVRPDVMTLAGLTPIDSMIFQEACRISIAEGQAEMIEGKRLSDALMAKGVSEAQTIETQEILEGRRYITQYRGLGPPYVTDFGITLWGFDQFVSACLPQYGETCTAVVRQMVRDKRTDNGGIADALGQPPRIIDHILQSLEANGMIRLAHYKGVRKGPRMGVNWISPELGRNLIE